MRSLVWSSQVPSSQTKVEATGVPHGWQKAPSRKSRQGLSPWSSIVPQHKTYIPRQAASDAEKG